MNKGTLFAFGLLLLSIAGLVLTFRFEKRRRDRMTKEEREAEDALNDEMRFW